MSSHGQLSWILWRSSSQLLYPNTPYALHTQLDDDGEMFLALHAYLCGSISHLAIALGVKARIQAGHTALTALTAEHLTRLAITKT